MTLSARFTAKSGGPPPLVAARNAAALFVERLDLAPPVRIRALLRTRAELDEAVWPTEAVEAVMLRRGDGRPQVFYRPLPDNRGRERFTLAHELGHIMLPWHVGNSACAPGVGVFDSTTATEEEQADTFASCVLAPDRWLLHLTETFRGDMSGFLRALEDARMSTTASLMAIRRVLLAGWVFQMNRQTTVFSSLGTSGPSLKSSLGVLS